MRRAGRKAWLFDGLEVQGSVLSRPRRFGFWDSLSGGVAVAGVDGLVRKILYAMTIDMCQDDN
jgi:hypothetical protein